MPDIETDTKDLERQALLLGAGETVEGWGFFPASKSARVAFHHELNLYYKEFLPRGPAERLKGLARGTRGQRSRINNDLLREEGFEAPGNVAWGKLPGNREYLITTAVSGQSVAGWLLEKLPNSSSQHQRQRRQLLRQLGLFIGRVHCAGFTHGDLRCSNVLASMEQEKFRFSLIDNERNTYGTSAPGKLVCKNLMQLNMLVPADLSRSDRMRFFLAWHSQMGELSTAEAQLLGTEAYLWAMRRLQAKGRI